MITTKSDLNSSKYIALFEDAFKFLKKYALEKDAFPAVIDNRENRKAVLQALVDAGVERFSSVQEYFSHIQDLLYLHDVVVEGKKLNGRKYLMLPLDEPVFEVDANKREIIVPAEFKKNGISVQGDEIAESLIFKINRFFDYADLREMIPQVQWENANKETGTSSIYVVDDSKNADYLYLMWPLKEEITKYPGTIKFSLRFYNNVGSELVYSFSTKIAAATINASHNFSYDQLSTNVIDAADNFLNAIKNSTNTAAEDAATPYFLLNLDQVVSADIMPQGRTAEDENADLVVNEGMIPHLEAYIDETDHPVQYLRVQAATSDTGLISYSWKYRDTVDQSIQGGVTYDLIPSTEPEEIYLRSEDILPQPHKVYYKKANNEYSITDYDPNDTMYEKYSVVAVTKNQLGRRNMNDANHPLDHVVGIYNATATNSVGGNTSECDSYIIEFPAPKVLDFAEGGDLGDNAFLGSGNSGQIEVTVVIDEHGAKDTYEWEYGPTLAGPFTPISGLGSTLTPEQQAKLSANGNKLTIADLPGFYRVRAISTRNYETIEKLSNVCKVTPQLKAPVITYPTKDMAVSSLYNSVTLAVTIQEFASQFDSENVTYQWYKWVNGEVQPIEGANSTEFVVPMGTDDAFCCEAINHMGEETAVARSKNFSVQPFKPSIDNDDDDDEQQGGGETPVTPEPEPQPDPELTISAAKLAQVPQDANASDALNNQNEATVTQTGNAIQISADIDALIDYTVEGATHKWIGVDVNTGLASIVGAQWGDQTLTQADATEASDLGLGAGHIVYWAKADELVNGAETVTISATGYSNTTITISFENTQG